MFRRHNTRSFILACSLLGQHALVIIDRPLGSRHPRHGFRYEVNYGFIPGTLAPDGEALDTYLLGVAEPVSHGSGSAIALIHREDDDDDKLVVLSDGAIADGVTLSDADIMKAVHFQEQFFESCVVRAS